MRRHDALGEFEQAVLLAIVHLDDDAYGVSIRREIEGRTKRHIAVGALYTALDRLAEKAYVMSRMSAPTAKRGGRAKKHFHVTNAGLGALRQSREFLGRMWAGAALGDGGGRA
jgi:DNA-binding PadR family transcriptional regulator